MENSSDLCQRQGKCIGKLPAHYQPFQDVCMAMCKTAVVRQLTVCHQQQLSKANSTALLINELLISAAC